MGSLTEASVLTKSEEGLHSRFLDAVHAGILRNVPLMTDDSFATKNMFKVKSDPDADS